MFGLGPTATVGQLESAIKEAILEGVIPNEHNAALAFVIEEAKKIGIERVK